MGNLFFIQTMKFRRSSAIANSTSPSVLSRPILSFFPPLRLPEKKEEKLGEFLAFPDAKKKFPTRDHRDKVFDSIRRNVQHVQHLSSTKSIYYYKFFLGDQSSNGQNSPSAKESFVAVRAREIEVGSNRKT